jgi:two-component system OmpR family sensor kinase
MTRHFLGLYLLIVGTLAAVSWGQDKLLQFYGGQNAGDDRVLLLMMHSLSDQLAHRPVAEWSAALAVLAHGDAAARFEVFKTSDITGADLLVRLQRGELAYLQGSHQSWTLRQIDAEHVLAYEVPDTSARRSPLEWGITFAFYALIALVVMLWIWPLRRDLRELEQSAASYGNRNWQFRARIKPHSQIYPLAQTFRRMAARIDGLIASHKDMSNAISHEIKTPLSRMKFEIELAQQRSDAADMRQSLEHIRTDIDAINDLVRATMEYAILERADLTLNLDRHDFTQLLPGILDQIRQRTPSAVALRLDVQAEATSVRCDLHLLETVLNNLVHNALRYARAEVAVSFRLHSGRNHLLVEDDGPGIAEQDRQRVFDSFVQLDQNPAQRIGYGLGLTIVQRAISWHQGEVAVASSVLGGACFTATWPDA